MASMKPPLSCHPHVTSSAPLPPSLRGSASQCHLASSGIEQAIHEHQVQAARHYHLWCDELAAYKALVTDSF